MPKPPKYDYYNPSTWLVSPEDADADADAEVDGSSVGVCELYASCVRYCRCVRVCVCVCKW